jgi:hypothetical protein
MYQSNWIRYTFLYCLLYAFNVFIYYCVSHHESNTKHIRFENLNISTIFSNEFFSDLLACKYTHKESSFWKKNVLYSFIKY